ncbi:mitochondrial 37S ribosomal protein mS35 RSM24 [Rhodotorula paludigena]|uniref:mitochondrial 37S ribosomal protein mS35 RSM24 n=1 Tax=Rhodotorula paludigena TaxID=86838 RepID=UPI0031813497
MHPSPPSFLAASSRALARRPPGAFASRRNPLDIANAVGPGAPQFDFPLTRPTLLKLDKQRQILHYLRLEQLQFKDLVAFRQPFVPPSPSAVVQVRHQHYQGEPHPASRKVTLSVPVSALPLRTPQQTHKLKLLAGARWTPPLPGAGTRQQGKKDEGTLKIACELFPSERMNEKWCSDTLDKLLAAARDAKDTFADIPLDPRPARARLAKSRKLKRNISLRDFPQEWLPAASKA